MKSLSLPSINKNQLLYWVKTTSITGIAQVFVQGVGFVTGIMIIRLLPAQEYAFYTITNTMLGMMNTFSDNGISTGVYALGAKVWTDKNRLGIVLNEGIKLRNLFSIIVLIICIPLTAYLLFEAHASWLTIVLIIIGMLPAFKVHLSDNLYEVVPKLHQDLYSLQKNQLLVSFMRLLMTGLFLVLFPFTWIAVFSTSVPRYWGNKKLRKIVEKNANLDNPDESFAKETRQGLISILKRTLPGGIYYAFAGQITLWILSYTGKTMNIASWGALGRYSIIFSILTTFFAMMIVPRYARLEAHRPTLFKMAHKILSIQIVLGLLVVALIYLFYQPLLWMLGTSYQGLKVELLLVGINGFLGMLTGTCLALNNRRGWIIHPVLDVAMNFIPMVVLIAFLPLKTLRDVLIYNNVFQLIITLFFYSMFIYHLIVNARKVDEK